MSAARCHSVCFSPTGGTAKLVAAFAQGTGLPHVATDITLPAQRQQSVLFAPDSLVLLAAPVYFGRVVKAAAEAFAALQGQGLPVVLLVNYGNRHYDDALLELHTLARKAAFVPFAAGAFISEHSFSTRECPMAPGRPDEADLERAGDFGRAVMEHMRKGGRPLERVPGNVPFKEYPEARRAPVQDMSVCCWCGQCAAACPTGAVTVSGARVTTSEEHCILCQACVKQCPTRARTDSAPGARELRERLGPLLRERREPECFMEA